jgi:predicted PurR-regulated permease PerM
LVAQRGHRVATFDAQVAALGGRVVGSVGEQLVNVPLTMAKLLFDLAMIYVIATLLVLRRDRTRDVMAKIWVRLGGYLRAKVVVMVCVGLLMYVALRVLGVPASSFTDGVTPMTAGSLGSREPVRFG